MFSPIHGSVQRGTPGLEVSTMFFFCFPQAQISSLASSKLSVIKETVQQVPPVLEKSETGGQQQSIPVAEDLCIEMLPLSAGGGTSS